MPANATELTLDVITASHLAVPASDTTEYVLDSAN
jgi:hypothetical protein